MFYRMGKKQSKDKVNKRHKLNKVFNIEENNNPLRDIEEESS